MWEGEGGHTFVGETAGGPQGENDWTCGVHSLIEGSSRASSNKWRV